MAAGSDNPVPGESQGTSPEEPGGASAEDPGVAPSSPRKRRWGLYGAVGLMPLVAVLALVWIASSLGPSQEAEYAIFTGGGVEVAQTDAGLEFAPSSTEPSVGVIVYPGGKVDYRSYAVLAREMVERFDVLVVIAPMTLDLAILSADRAQVAVDAHDGIESWTIVGHSLGGVAACTFVADAGDPGQVKALALLAAYPAEDTDLSDVASLESVVSITGSEDLLLDREAFEAARERLPASTQYVEVEGANHAQWGSYGEQPGDGIATITAEEQRGALLDVLEGVLASGAGEANDS